MLILLFRTSGTLSVGRRRLKASGRGEWCEARADGALLSLFNGGGASSARARCWRGLVFCDVELVFYGFEAGEDGGVVGGGEEAVCIIGGEGEGTFGDAYVVPPELEEMGGGGIGDGVDEAGGPSGGLGGVDIVAVGGGEGDVAVVEGVVPNE